MVHEDDNWWKEYYKLQIEDQVFISRVSETSLWIYRSYFQPITSVMDSEFIDGDLIYEELVENFAPHLYIQKEVLRYVDELPFNVSSEFGWRESGAVFFPADEPEDDKVTVHQIMMLCYDMLKQLRDERGVNIVEV